jgi:hypothetical protein
MAEDGSISSAYVFGKGLLDTIDHVFWMLPFSSIREANRVRHDNGIRAEEWSNRRRVISAEHSLDNARAELARLWKEWMRRDSDACKPPKDPAAVRINLKDGELPYQDE